MTRIVTGPEPVQGLGIAALRPQNPLSPRYASKPPEPPQPAKPPEPPQPGVRL